MATPVPTRSRGSSHPPRPGPRPLGGIRAAWGRVLRSWPVHGYRASDARHLVAIIAYHTLTALVPTLLLLAGVVGLVLRDDRALGAAIHLTVGIVPAAGAGDALEGVLSARSSGGWLGAASLLGFLWVGTGFADGLAYCLNRVHGVPGCGIVCTRRKGFLVVLGVAVLFLAAALAATLPALPLPPGVPGPAMPPTAGRAVAVVVAVAMFLFLYRVLPNAGQTVRDVWPGALTAALLFTLLGQVFPLYLSLAGGANRFGALFGFVWLLVTWFAAVAHVLLFGAYVNATLMARRRRRAALAPTAPRPRG